MATSIGLDVCLFDRMGIGLKTYHSTVQYSTSTYCSYKVCRNGRRCSENDDEAASLVDVAVHGKRLPTPATVSYTHLTLPTIYSV